MSYKVIIVDNEDIIVRGVSTLLPWEKYHCEVAGTANNGLEALDIIKEKNIDIMFTDIRMPKMDGISLIAAIKSEFPDMQITILSGYPDFQYAQEAIKLGVSNYILKPSRMDELESALKKMVDNLDAQVKDDTKQEEIPVAGNFVLNNAIKYIKQEYSKPLTLQEVADKVYVSQWHLSKLISKHTGQRFSDILNGIRIQEAKKLLEDPSLKIWEISERVGFLDVTHFARRFRKTENCSANEYRNKYLGFGKNSE